MKVLLRVLGVGVLVTAVACSSPPPEPPAPGVVATYERGEVTALELEEFIVSFPPEQRQPAEDQSLQAWRLERLEALVLGRLLEQEARAEGLLEEGPGADSWARARESLLISTIEEEMMSPRLVVTEEDLREFYDANPSEFGHDGRIRVRHIFKRVDRDASEAERATAREALAGLKRQVEQGGNFDDIARENSDSETAPLGGLIGRIDQGVLDASLEGLLWSLEPGAMSDIVDTPIGFHVFKLDSKIEPFRTSYEEARGRLTRRLGKEARAEAESEFLGRLLEESGASFHPDRLSSLDEEVVLFELGEEQVTLGEFLSGPRSEGFSAARESPLEQRLEQSVLRRLYLWEGERQGVAERPELVESLEGLERNAAVEAARSVRLQRIIETVPEARLRDAYEADNERYQTPRLVRLKLLTLDFPEDEKVWYGVYEAASELRERIRSGSMTFEQAAKEHSTDFSRRDGGDVGAIRVDAFIEWAGPSAGKVIRNLAVNELSPPLLIERYNRDQLVYDRAGFLLARVEEILEPGKQDFETARDNIVGHLVRTKAIDPDAEMRVDLEDEYQVSFHLGDG